MKPYISLFALALGLFLATPDTSLAYFTTAQSATMITPTTGLYTITYNFGLAKNDVYLPIATTRNLRHGESDTTLGYTIQTDDNQIVTGGDSAAIVLSNAKLVDGMYRVPAGTNATFVLTAFYKLDAATPDDRFKIQVEQLPFVAALESSNDQRSLNPSELKKYVTPSLALN